ncbi:MAG: S-layer homology domain-containing protein [Acetivibrionales bacterium]|nr:S-layer homology domain-containing protein [Clostridiaceae bacterium]
MRKCYIKIFTIILMLIIAVTPLNVMAVEGTMGYAGGISVEDPIEKSEYEYTEMCFLTGVPVKLTGTLTIKKTDKNDVVTSTYTYKLANTESDITMNRVVIYTTTRETKLNGQITESTKLSRTPTEVINVGGKTFRLIESGFTQSMITDPKAAINFHTGEFSEKKVYAIGTDLTKDRVTVTLSGRTYAYDQYWSSTETQRINVMVETDIKSTTPSVKWGGVAEIVVSSATLNQVHYAKNEPTQISFDGGYVNKKWMESTLDYTARFPEFDKNGLPTDVLKTYTDTQSLSTQMELSRLMVPDIKHLNGHWAEEPISILFGLEILPGTGSNFKVGRYLTRREFVGILMNALKDIPTDPDVRTAMVNTRRTSSKKAPEISPFKDIEPGDFYYEEIKKAYQKGITKGNGNGNFGPNEYITNAEAIKMIVSALGLENLAPYPSTTTPFVDNDSIPTYARNSASVASVLGIIEPDYMGRFNPSNRLTNENAANLIFDLINYMGDELIKDYRDRMIDF